MNHRQRAFVVLFGAVLSVLIAGAFVLSGLTVPQLCGSRMPPKISFWPSFRLAFPFAGVAIPALLVWRFGLKPVKPGHCRCGYDLTGNTSGVCPECGVEVQA